MNKNRVYRWLLSLILCGFFIFYSFAKTEDKLFNLQLFAKVLNLVQEYYVESIDVKKLIYGSIKGMLQELDPHTNFLSPEDFPDFQSETAGEFGGLGVELTVKDDILTIISPIEDAPAWKAGILAGDQIASIDGQSTKGFTLVDAAKLMKGPKGKSITLGIMREGFTKEQPFLIIRGVVKIKSVKTTQLEPGYFYIRISSFIENTGRDLENSLVGLKSKGSIKGLIIDLRQNPGGLLDQAIKVADLFLEKGIIVSTIGRNKEDKEVVYAKEEGTYKDFPMVVMIDEYSASASEIVTGALKDNQRALVVGKRSFGKGSVQSVIKLGDGSGLKLTVARYFTPSGKSIQAEGVHPDIIIESYDSKKLEQAREEHKVNRERDIRGHLKSDEELSQNQKRQDKKTSQVEGKEKPLLERDYQISQAFNFLKTGKVFRSLTF